MPQYLNTAAVPRGELSDVLMESAYSDTSLVGLQLFPDYPVEDMSSHLPLISLGKGNFLRAARKKRAPGSNFVRWTSSISDYQFKLEQVGEEILIPDESTWSYDKYFDLEATYTVEAGSRLRRGHEMDVADALMNPTSFGTPRQPTESYNTTNIATFNFSRDISAAIRAQKAKGIAPDTIAVPGPILDLIIESVLAKNYVVGQLGAGKEVNSQTLGASFAQQGITKFIALDSYVNTSEDEKDDEIEQIYKSDYIFVGKTASGELRNGGIGRTAFWSAAGPVFNVMSYRDETVSSNVIRGRRIAIPVITNAKAGTLIATTKS